ncbi:hypothetical protein EVAR_56976_1 [Eumeta japonica]|uniref:Uncharacterized protein n=1 Tax=Eumeta variegata TaxID=151549 RepID=A0A4C1ZAC1_EUMVA|nr:hypothetical protein EVAR_56976_1 [Eumeta japonica]
MTRTLLRAASSAAHARPPPAGDTCAPADFQKQANIFENTHGWTSVGISRGDQLQHETKWLQKNEIFVSPRLKDLFRRPRSSPNYVHKCAPPPAPPIWADDSPPGAPHLVRRILVLNKSFLMLSAFMTFLLFASSSLKGLESLAVSPTGPRRCRYGTRDIGEMLE